MPIELDNTTINIIDGADTYQVDFVKSKGSYIEKAVDTTAYSCGFGYYGQLGNGTGDKYTPTLIQHFANNNIEISQVSSGHFHSIFLATNGNVYSCGFGGFGELGHGNTSQKTTPTLIQYFVNNSITISQVSCSYQHSVFLATNGNVYSCGIGSSGRLGHGNTSNKFTPTLIQYFFNNSITISQISSGHLYSVFLATNGNVYSCGNGSNGQLGHGNISDQSTPKLIQYFDTNSITISQVSCGGDHSVFLATNGNVYSCGNGNYDQLGHGDTSNKSTPTLIQYFDNNSITISQVSGGYLYSLFLATDGNVYSCGRNEYGQLGHGDTSNQSTPTLIQYFDTNNITISQVFGDYYHSIFLSTDGNVYSCGYNTHGGLGHGDTSNQSTPTLIQFFANSNITILNYSCGYYHSIFISNNPYFATIEYPAQWKYSSSDANVYYLDNVGIGTTPSNTKILNVENGINFIGDLYINNYLIDTPKYKHAIISKNNRYFPVTNPNIDPSLIVKNNNQYYIFSFVYDSSNNNGSGQTEYTINFSEETECDILVVAGGGGGGWDRAGGGGAGGLIFKSQKLNGYYTILVGDGGNGSTSNGVNGGNGYNSSIINNFNNINNIINEEAIGGGGGGTYNGGGDGGSGGGAHGQSLSYIYGYSTHEQGNRGGSGSDGSYKNSGGGGGAGGAGGDGITGNNPGYSGNGGIGLDYSNYYGTSYGDDGWFAGGGGGSIAFDGYSGATASTSSRGGRGGGGDAGLGRSQHGSPGLSDTGGGGGGGANINVGNGGKGGSGVVIIRCKISKPNLNIPIVSNGVIDNINEYEQTNTLTFGYNENYPRYNYYPELTTFSDTANLIAWYKFDAVPTNGATLTNYGSGGSAYDATLNIASNGIERLDGYNAQYRYHWKSDAASGNYISIPGNILQSLYENGHTICYWAKDASTSDSNYTVIATNSNGGGNDIYIRINAPWNNNNVYYDNGDGAVNSSRLTGASGISTNELVFWTFTRVNISSTEMMLKIYKNGVVFLSGTYTRYNFTNASSSSIFYIGYNMPTISVDHIFKNKSLEDFRIYDRALRHEEIEQLHLEFTNNKLHAHYKFNDSSNLGIDSTSNSYDATIYGTPEHISPDTISFNVGDGSQYLIFPTDVIKDSGTTREELSFSIWVNKQESYTGTANYFGIDNDTDTNLSKTIFFGQSSSGATYTHFRYGNNYLNINTAYDNRESNIWNHYALVLRKDGSNANIKFYVNGIEYTAYNSNVAWIELDDNLKINSWQTGLHHQTSKHVRDFRVYNTALSASQIRYIYKSSSSVYNQSKYTLQFDRDTECDILVVAGGGGGGSCEGYNSGGGGGAGELLEKYNLTFTANTQYTIVVGNGGKGQLNINGPAIEGYDSGIFTGINGDTPFYHSKGGGRGAFARRFSTTFWLATSGGSGGGGGRAYDTINGLTIKYNTDGHGHDGRIGDEDGGGGGGAGSGGEYINSSSSNNQSPPGKGYTSYITGEAVTYASGGYGGWQFGNNNTIAGKGSGGWGRAAVQNQTTVNTAGDGIDGIVIIKYKYLTGTSVSNFTYTMNSWTYTNEGDVYYMGNVGIGSNRPTEKLDVDGNISGSTKSFKIQHPLNNNLSLYHGNIECPRYDNIYRGRATIVGGTCIVDIDSECNDVGGLIEGTFEALNTDSQLYLQNNQTFDNVKGTIENGKIHIECENVEDEITINWIVIAERKDTSLLNLNNTNTAGKLICEHFK